MDAFFRFVTRQRLVVVLVAGLTGLAQLKFMSFLSESVRERLEIITTTSAQDFGAAIDLGLTLSEVANGQAILNRARSHDPAKAPREAELKANTG